jgi:hypothetical protein
MPFLEGIPASLGFPILEYLYPVANLLQGLEFRGRI